MGGGGQDKKKIGAVCTRGGCGWLWLVLGCRAGGDRLAVLLMASHLLLLRNRHNSESWEKCRKKHNK